eukprot:CAMPEP_0181126524 /NCGR_PEP_ID=MMETSP1071-20121207/27683_1 /TAXON_ID=35127 /ORGANISM="Thalassiosira sp., Strain NH16" /LENGTH=527 /DNA_ID=CAMNT_0023212147 /DNA_START=292 /DNA_END=1875 /DNA_ORIENTATION=+
MGRRLAQERSKNHQLMQQIRELEISLSSLQGGNPDAMDNRPNNPGFASPPVSTPPARCGTVNSSEEANLHNASHAHDLEGGLPLETQSQEIPTSHIHPADVVNDSVRENSTFEVSSNSSVMNLLENASNLLANSEGSQRVKDDNKKSTGPEPSDSHGSHDGLVLTQERMHEYHELVTAFHSEQQSHGDLHGEEMISREDIVWLLQELKWRFEDILRGYATEMSKKKDESPPEQKEWKECLEGLVDVVKKAMTGPPSSCQSSNQQGFERTTNISNSNNARILQNEVSSLNQRLASFAAQHKETCRSLYDDMDAIKRDCQEKLANKSQSMQNLESKILEQEEYIAQIQKEAQKDQIWIQKEKQKITMSKEGTVVRIRYLEGMLRSLQTELKESKTPQGKNPISNDKVEVNEERAALSPPVFMRDLALAMQDNDLVQNTAIDDHALNKCKYKADGDILNCTKPSSDGDEMTKLRDQAASLGNSLADSETRRANLLEDFQKERKKYILQYKQMSDVLKLLIEDEKCNHNYD